mmetsp:Transcript_12415/g.41354  ORF Transcript_12415/g.41354 Transcript_12415/m.41354 type:complete len:216 (-) Transcript_12415:234-881(-)
MFVTCCEWNVEIFRTDSISTALNNSGALTCIVEKAQAVCDSASGVKFWSCFKACVATASKSKGASILAVAKAHAVKERAFASNDSKTSNVRHSAATALNRSGASNPTVANAQTVLDRFWAVKDPTFSSASRAIQMKRGPSRQSSVAKAQDMSAKDWASKAVIFDVPCCAIISKRAGALTFAVAKALAKLAKSGIVKSERRVRDSWARHLKRAGAG